MLVKCVIIILELNEIGSSALEVKKKGKNLWVSAHVVHTISKQVISRNGKNENGCKTYKVGKKKKERKKRMQACNIIANLWRSR